MFFLFDTWATICVDIFQALISCWNVLSNNLQYVSIPFVLICLNPLLNIDIFQPTCCVDMLQATVCVKTFQVAIMLFVPTWFKALFIFDMVEDIISVWYGSRHCLYLIWLKTLFVFDMVQNTSCIKIVQAYIYTNILQT